MNLLDCSVKDVNDIIEDVICDEKEYIKNSIINAVGNSDNIISFERKSTEKGIKISASGSTNHIKKFNIELEIDKEEFDKDKNNLVSFDYIGTF